MLVENGGSGTWGTSTRDVREGCTLRTRSTGASPARSTSTRTCRASRRLARTTRIVSVTKRSDWSSRTACRTEPPRGTCGATIASSSLGAPSRSGWRRRGGKSAERIPHEYLDWALSDFSGYIAADELYDGPFCILSIVDNHNFKRLMYEVLDHNPTHEDMERFFERFKAALDARGLKLLGVTTDGSPLYPEPLRKVFGEVAHQICEFHVLADITKAVLRAVAKVRKQLDQKKPKIGRGRPTVQTKKLAQKRKRLQQRIADLFEYRHLFVQRHLTDKERRTLARISRGFPHLRALREIMENVYRLFDRRCKTETAIEKLKRLRARVKRFKSLGKTLQKLFSPTLEKALNFLDDSLLPSTSNAVERGNRRHRKMQKSVYRVRTQRSIVNRIALDLIREMYGPQRNCTLRTLHHARAG